MKISTAKATVNAAPSAAPFGCIETVMLVRTHTSVVIGDGHSRSLGEVVDRHLEEMAMSGNEVQSFTLHIDEKQWRDFANLVNQTKRDTWAD
jgi:hypothetical protein